MLSIRARNPPDTDIVGVLQKFKVSFNLLVSIYFIVTSLTGAVAKYCDESLCLCVSLSVCPRGYLRNHMRDLYQIFVHVAYVRGSVLLRHVDNRPHCLLPGRGWQARAKCNLWLRCRYCTSPMSLLCTVARLSLNSLVCADVLLRNYSLTLDCLIE